MPVQVMLFYNKATKMIVRVLYFSKLSALSRMFLDQNTQHILQTAQNTSNSNLVFNLGLLPLF